MIYQQYKVKLLRQTSLIQYQIMMVLTTVILYSDYEK